MTIDEYDALRSVFPASYEDMHPPTVPDALTCSVYHRENFFSISTWRHKAAKWALGRLGYRPTWVWYMHFDSEGEETDFAAPGEDWFRDFRTREDALLFKLAWSGFER